jgi:hypothetical protein
MVPRNALTTAPESDPDVLRRGTRQAANLLSRAWQLEDEAMARKREITAVQGPKKRMWKDPRKKMRS